MSGVTQLKVFISFCWDLSWFTVLLLALNKTATLSLALVEIWGSALCCGMEAAREKLSHSRNWNWSMEINYHIRMLSITFEFIVYKLSWDNMWRQKTMISYRIFPFLFSKTVTVIKLNIELRTIKSTTLKVSSVSKKSIYRLYLCMNVYCLPILSVTRCHVNLAWCHSSGVLTLVSK